MKLTKKLLEQYIKEAWQQKLFGGEEEIKPPAEPAAPSDPPPVSREYTPAPANTVRGLLNSYIKGHMRDEYLQALDLGPKELFRLYMLNSKWSNAWGENPDSTEIGNLPKIVNVTKMQSGITDVEYSNGDVESHQPYGVDVNQMYVRRRR